MESFVEKNDVVTLKGKEYSIRELSLAQKITIIEPISGFIKDIANKISLKKNGKDGFKIDLPDEINLAEFNIDKILMGSINLLPEILRLSIPKFTDWDNVSETETREALSKVLAINDFAGFVANFISLAGDIIRSPKL